MTVNAISDNITVLYNRNMQVSLTSMTVSFSGGGFLLRHRLESVQVTLRRKFTCRNYPRKEKTVTQPAVNPQSCNISCVNLFDYNLFSLAVFFLLVEGEGLWRLHELDKSGWEG